MKIYAGIGSRKTPPEILLRMYRIASQLAREGWLLRSGHADGADMTFEEGCNFAVLTTPDLQKPGPGMRFSDVGIKEIILPWSGFNGSHSNFFRTMPEAFAIAESVIPYWRRLNRPAQLLHARNVHQVLGPDLKSPVDMVVCWTPGGKEVGGTVTALKVAALQPRAIPVYNLASLPDDEWLSRLQPNGFCRVEPFEGEGWSEEEP